MTETEAIELLKKHSYAVDSERHPEVANGFLGMLRPFSGKLVEANFHEVMAVLKTLVPLFRNEHLDREIMANIWAICHLSRAWGIEKEGMLRRNNLITREQTEQLSVWIDCISYTVMSLLSGAGEAEAFEAYQFYLEEANHE